MERLIEGHKKFLAEVFPRRRKPFHLLAESQAPECLFITCSDSRIVPDLILGTGPGDLFISRNAGNVVPVTGHDVDGVYSHDRIRGGSAEGEARDSLRPLRLRRHEGGARPQRLEACPRPAAGCIMWKPRSAIASPEPCRWAECRAGFADPRQRGGAAYEPARAAIRRPRPGGGRLTVHGWYYDILTGRIEHYDERLRRFLPLITEN